ncbi:MAG: DUF3368 domain-containing protein [Deltaproteobacteria bacterium]|nr:DUF3368 domain-containing protein [Deltaproteobacteria bacterium]
MVDAVVDNTVLSNFALIKREDVLMKVFDGVLYTFTEVLQEFQLGKDRGILPDIDWSWIRVLEIESEQEEHLFERLTERLGMGESACLSLAVNRNIKILTDDLDTRNYAQRLAVPVSGTIGVLVLAVKKGIISLEEGNKSLVEMVENGYYSPYNALDDLL